MLQDGHGLIQGRSKSSVYHVVLCDGLRSRLHPGRQHNNVAPTCNLAYERPGCAAYAHDHAGRSWIVEIACACIRPRGVFGHDVRLTPCPREQQRSSRIVSLPYPLRTGQPGMETFEVRHYRVDFRRVEISIDIAVKVSHDTWRAIEIEENLRFYILQGWPLVAVVGESSRPVRRK
jgi:hypothetical protein